MTPEQWFHSVPPVTKTIMCSVVLITILTATETVSVYSIVFEPSLVFKRFHIWRLFSCFLFLGPPSFGWIFSMMFLVRYCTALETQGSPGDFVWILLLLMFSTLSSYFVLGNMMVYGSSLLFAILYLWSRGTPHAPVNFWGFTLESWHFPFVIMAMHTIMGGQRAFIQDAVGLLAGHLVHFTKDIVPRMYGVTLISTPGVIKQLVEITIPGLLGKVPTPASNPQVRTHNWQRTPGHSLR